MSSNDWNTVSKWAPTIVALIGIAGTLYYTGERDGRMEARIRTAEEHANKLDARMDSMVPRIEYSAAQAFTASQVVEVKQGVRDLNSKVDRLLERRP
jgi:hypothetical protein